MTRSYYRGAAGAMLVYDVSCRESYEHVPMWLSDAKRLAGTDIVVMLIGNKCDQAEDKREVPFLDASDFAQKNGLLFLETSALSGQNVQEAFLKLSKTIISKIDGGEIDPANNPRGIHRNEINQESRCYC